MKSITIKGRDSNIKIKNDLDLKNSKWMRGINITKTGDNHYLFIHDTLEDKFYDVDKVKINGTATIHLLDRNLFLHGNIRIRVNPKSKYMNDNVMQIDVVEKRVVTGNPIAEIKWPPFFVPVGIPIILTL